MRDMNIRTAVASAMVAVMLLVSFFSVVLAADPTADASRTIDPQVVDPGGEVNITVQFTSLLGVQKSFALLEDIPADWGFTNGTNDNIAFRFTAEGDPEWVWVVGAGATKTATYTLTVPLDADPGDYVINGTVTGNGTVNLVGGDNTITVSGEALYDLTMAAEPEAGGTATDLTNGSPYAEDTEVSIEAVAAEGYRFVNWTAPAGGLGNASAENTIFTMPAQNVTVTAHFELVGPPVYPTVTTVAATGITTSSATLNMNYGVGNYTSVDVRFAYKKSVDTAWSNTSWVSKSASGTYAEPCTGLSSSTTYDFKAQLRYDSTVINGTTLHFTTGSPAEPPSGDCCAMIAAYGTSTAKQLNVLREFRDDVLLESTAGPQFVALYYDQISPPIVTLMSGNSFLRTFVRELLLDPIVWFLESTDDVWRN